MRPPDHEAVWPVGASVSLDLRATIDDPGQCNRIALRTVMCPGGACPRAVAWLLRDHGELVLVSVHQSTPITERHIDYLDRETDKSIYGYVSCGKHPELLLCRQWVLAQASGNRGKVEAPLDHAGHGCALDEGDNS